MNPEIVDDDRDYSQEAKDADFNGFAPFPSLAIKKDYAKQDFIKSEPEKYLAELEYTLSFTIRRIAEMKGDVYTKELLSHYPLLF